MCVCVGNIVGVSYLCENEKNRSHPLISAYKRNKIKKCHVFFKVDINFL